MGTALTPDDLRSTWFEQAVGCVSRAELEGILTDMVRIPSPPGRERAVNEMVVARLQASGIDAEYQPLDRHRGNAIGRIGGDGSGPDLLLTTHVDFGFGLDDDDLGFTEPVRWDFSTEPIIEGDQIIGLAAENPKGHAACLLAAVLAVHRAGIPLHGDVVLGLVAGGMPTGRAPGDHDLPWNLGLGAGMEHMLRHGVTADFALLGKTGNAVAWEEVGLCWFEIRARGLFAYAGTRNIAPYNNPILALAVVLPELDEWLREYSRQHTSGTIGPQGSIGAIAAGWSYKPTFVPEYATARFDLRISPDSSPQLARREVNEFVAGLSARYPEAGLQCRMLVGIPGGRTDEDNWIVKSCLHAWETVEGRPHEPRLAFGGFTDFPILRMWGLPVARLGMRPGTPPPGREGWTLGVASIPAMIDLTKKYVTVIVDTCTRSRAEVGL